MWTIDLPLRIAISKKSEFALNLNPYRNAHFQVLNKAKENFDQLARGLIRNAGIPSLVRCSLEYTLYPGSRQLCDTNNICSIVDKFFSDSLVSSGVLADDNYNFIADTRFRFGYVDKLNPRVTVVIRSPDHIPTVPPELVTESKPMKIQTIVTLSQEDVNTAFREFLAKGNFVLPTGTNVFLHQFEDETFQLEFQPELGASTVTAEQPQKKTGGRKTRLEPKAAIQALNTPASTETDTKPVDEQPAPEVDHSPHTPEEIAERARRNAEEDKIRAAGGTVPPVITEEPKKDSETEVPPQPIKQGLFSGFTRPKN